MSLNSPQLKHNETYNIDIFEIYDHCYNLYKKEYLGDLDFSIESQEITEEIDELINEFDYNLKRRNDILSTNVEIDLKQEEISEKTNQEKNTKIKQVRKFSDIQKFNRNLEIKTDDELEDEEKEKFNENIIIIENKNEIKDKSIQIEETEYSRKESSNINLKDEDYDLSQSIIRTEVNERNYSIMIEKKNDISLSQAQILMDSQITHNPLNFSNCSIRRDLEEMSMFHSKNRSNAYDEKLIQAGFNNLKRRSINESLEMSFLNNKQYDNFNNMDTPDLEMIHNSIGFQNEIIFKNDQTFQNEENLIEYEVADTNPNKPNQSSSNDHSPKFMSYSVTTSLNLGDASKYNIIDRYFNKIFNNKTINIKNYSFTADINFTDLKTEDSFLENFILLLNKENFLDDDFNQKVKFQFNNRFEIYFFEILKKFLHLKKELFCDAEKKNIVALKNNIIKQLEEMNFMLKNNIFLTDSEEFYIFKPLSLLKFWDNSTENNDLCMHNDLIVLFLIKTIMKKNRDIKTLIEAFKNVKNVFIDPNIYDKSQIIIYYFGKLLSIFIEKINEVKDEEILKILNKNNSENYKNIKKILLVFGYPNSYNYKKKAKNFEHLAIISEYFGDDSKT